MPGTVDPVHLLVYLISQWQREELDALLSRRSSASAEERKISAQQLCHGPILVVLGFHFGPIKYNTSTSKKPAQIRVGEKDEKIHTENDIRYGFLSSQTRRH